MVYGIYGIDYRWYGIYGRLGYRKKNFDNKTGYIAILIDIGN